MIVLHLCMFYKIDTRIVEKKKPKRFENIAGILEERYKQYQYNIKNKANTLQLFITKHRQA